MVRRIGDDPPEPVEFVGEWETVDYPVATRGAGFVLPPPARSGGAAEEVTRLVGEELARVADAADNADVRSSLQGEVIVDYGNALDDLKENRVVPWAVPTIAPLSQTINRRADPSFPLSSMLSPAFSANDIPDGDVTWSMSRGGSVKDRAYFVFLTPAVTRAYERLNFMVDAVSNPCEMGVAVYVLEPSRMLFRQVFIPDMGSRLPTGRSLVNVEFDRWVATQGSYVAVAFYQYGPGTTRRLLGLRDTPRPLDSSLVYPPRIASQAVSTGLTLPETVDGSTALSFDADWFVPYVELSEAVGELLASFHEPFNDGGYLSRPWVKLTDQAPYAAGGSVGVIRNLITGFLRGPRVSMFDSSVFTEHNAVEVVMGSLPSTGASRTWAVVRGTNNLLDAVALWVTRTRVEVRRWTVGNIHDVGSSAGLVAGIGHSVSSGDRLRAEFDGATGTVTVWINGAEAVVAPGLGRFASSRYRFAGLGFDKGEDGNVYPSRIADWRLWDVPGVGAGDDAEDDVEDE